MIQRVEQTGSFPIRPVTAVPVERVLPPAGSMLALPSGEIAGDLRRCDGPSRPNRATYELLVANNTPIPVATFAYAIEGLDQTRVTWDSIVVPAYSAVAVDIDVALPRDGRTPRMIAEVYAHDSQLTLDAKPPLALGGRRRSTRGLGLARRAIAALAGLAVVATGSLAYAAMRPQVVALAAPDTVAAGSGFAVAYAAGGATGAAYSVKTPDGREVAAGPLDPRGSSFGLTLPSAATSLGYDVRVTAQGPLGEDARSIHVVALAPVAPPAPVAAVKRRAPAPIRIAGVSLQSDSVDGGQPIVVSYTSNVPSGTVRLVDQYGNVRGESLLSGRGRSTLAAPFVDADQDLRVVITAQRGKDHAEAAVPVTIRHVEPATATAPTVPAPAPVAAAGVAASADTDPAPDQRAAAPAPAPAKATEQDVPEPAVALPGPPISVEATQVAGRPVAVHILRHDAGLHVAMMGPGGEEVVSQDVAPGESTVLLAPPAITGSHGTGYSIVATFSRGVAQETLIRPLAFRIP